MKKAKRNKELKSLELFKKGFRKNEIVIYAIALMLVTAGYFNYSANLDKTIETYSENIAKVEQNIINDNATIEEITASTNEVQDNTTVSKTDNKDEDIGDAKLVNSEVKEDKKQDSSDYFVSTKLQRDTTYADMISTYTSILEDSDISEPQKSIAMKEITKINDIKNAISVCENIISTKGFDQFVVLVNNESVNVVVKVEGGLKKEKVAQLQNIISRELNSKIENIHITEK